MTGITSLRPSRMTVNQAASPGTIRSATIRATSFELVTGDAVDRHDRVAPDGHPLVLPDDVSGARPRSPAFAAGPPWATESTMAPRAAG